MSDSSDLLSTTATNAKTSTMTMGKTVNTLPSMVTSVHCFRPTLKELAWPLMRKKILAMANTFVKSLEAWKTAAEARECFAHTLNMDSWCDLRKALRGLDDFESKYFAKENTNVSYLKNLLAPVFNSMEIVTFLDLPESGGKPSLDLEVLLWRMRATLEMLNCNLTNGHLTFNQARWIYLQHMVTTEHAGASASMVLSNYWGIDKKTFESNLEAFHKNKIKTSSSHNEDSRSLHAKLKSKSLGASNDVFWVKASSVLQTFKEEHLCGPKFEKDSPLSLTLASQIVTDETLLGISQHKKLAPKLVIGPSISLALLCRAGFINYDFTERECAIDISSVQKHTKQNWKVLRM